MKPLTIIISILLCGCAGWTPADKALLTASIVASYADYKTTSDLLDRGGHENNPCMGTHPSKGKLAVFFISSEVLTIAFAHYFPKYRKVLLGGKTAVNGYCAIHNSGE